jgi:hypothetical protein
MTLMKFDTLESVRGFMGEEYEAALVPPHAQAVLADFDRHSAHITYSTAASSHTNCPTAQISPSLLVLSSGCPGFLRDRLRRCACSGAGS